MRGRVAARRGIFRRRGGRRNSCRAAFVRGRIRLLGRRRSGRRVAWRLGLFAVGRWVIRGRHVLFLFWLFLFWPGLRSHQRDKADIRAGPDALYQQTVGTDR